MFKHILLPVDGSEISPALIRAAVALAKETNAKVTGMHVVPKFSIFTYDAEMLEDTKEQYIQASKKHAQSCLAEIESVARIADVKCETFYVTSDEPHEEIVKAARERKCDLIVMAAHGRRGIKGLLIGSQTQKVLTYSDIPVLVYR